MLRSGGRLALGTGVDWCAGTGLIFTGAVDGGFGVVKALKNDTVDPSGLLA